MRACKRTEDAIFCLSRSAPHVLEQAACQTLIASIDPLFSRLVFSLSQRLTWGFRAICFDLGYQPKHHLTSPHLTRQTLDWTLYLQQSASTFDLIAPFSRRGKSDSGRSSKRFRTV